MNGKKKLLSLVALVLALAAVLAFTVMADEVVYTGDPAAVEASLAEIEAAATADAKAELSASLKTYISEHPIDPETEGYAELFAKVDAVPASVAEAYLGEIDMSSSADGKAALAESLNKYLSGNPLRAETDAELIAKVSVLPKAITELYLAELESASVAEAKLSLAESLDKHLAKYPLADTETELIAKINAIPTAVVVAFGSETEAAADVATLIALFDMVNPYIEANPVEGPTEEYTAAIAKIDDGHLRCANALLSEINPEELGLAANGVKVRTLGSFLKNYPVNTELEGYTALAEAYAAAKLQYEEAKAAARTELIGHTSFVEYTYDTLFQNDFDGNGSGEFTPGNNKGTGVVAHVGPDSGKDGENGYCTVNYPFASHVYARVDFPHQPNNFVVDFDITTFGNAPTTPIRAETGSIIVDETSGKKIGPGYFYILPENGDFATGGSVSDNTLLLEGAFIKDEWFHITLIVHTDTYMIDYYGDYEYLGTYEIGARQGYDFEMLHFRIAANAADHNVGTEFQMDNFEMYAGSRLRDIDYVDNMTEEELFKFHASGISLPGVGYSVINKSYTYLKNNVYKYWQDNGNGSGSYLTEDAELRAAVDAYLAFDYDSVLVWQREINLLTYVSMVDELVAIERTPDTFEERQEKFTALQEFLNSNNGLVLIDERYTAASSLAGTVEAQLQNETVINDFITKIDSFYRSTNATAMIQLYDPIMQALPTLETELLNNPKYFLFADAYAKVPALDEMLADAISIDNTKRFIAAMDFLAEYDTEEEWDENYDYVNKYLAIARDVYKEGIDIYYGTAKEAYGFYSAITDHYFDRVQEGHVAYLEERISSYEKATSFVEKYGICSDILFYAEKNELDISNSRIAELLSTADTYHKQLLTDLDNYNAIIEDNTEKFLSAMAKLNDSSDFNAKLAVYAEAERYYGIMNVTGETALLAREGFKALGNEIAEIRASTVRFIGAATLLSGYESDELYYALIECYLFSASAEEQIEGCTEALAAMNTALSAYRQNVDTVNTELSATREAAVSCTAPAGGDAAGAFN